MLDVVKKIGNDTDIVLVHDGNRPLVSANIISNSISVCQEKGCAIAAIPCNDALLYSENKLESDSQISRDLVVRTQTPHVFKFGDLYEMHLQAKEKGINNSVASCTLSIELGRKVYFSSGSELNFKITVQDDLKMFKALLKSRD